MIYSTKACYICSGDSQLACYSIYTYQDIEAKYKREKELDYKHSKVHLSQKQMHFRIFDWRMIYGNKF